MRLDPRSGGGKIRQPNTWAVVLLSAAVTYTLTRFTHPSHSEPFESASILVSYSYFEKDEIQVRLGAVELAGRPDGAPCACAAGAVCCRCDVLRTRTGSLIRLLR